ncbi:MAG: hypothetical protein DGJ47_000652 [Rickettsiaceae bacterium]
MTKWYTIYTISGSEKSVKRAIEEQIVKRKMSDKFEDIVVPVVQVPEIKRGKKVITEKKIMPGYILIKMHMTDESWHLVKSVPKVAEFLGSKTTPQSLTDQEVETIFAQIKTQEESATESSMYNPGDEVQVIDGPFDTFSGVVEEVDPKSQTMKVSVSIFGKSTPIELSFTQVKKD